MSKSTPWYERVIDQGRPGLAEHSPFDHQPDCPGAYQSQLGNPDHPAAGRGARYFEKITRETAEGYPQVYLRCTSAEVLKC